jgi:aryl-alcohol dehydrogenase-like predicted oxidoreductase
MRRMMDAGDSYARARLPESGAGTLALGGGLSVCRMGFGARWISNPEIARDLLRRAVELGVNVIDTADSYGPGVSEQLICEALHPYPDGFVIATKGGQVVDAGNVVANGRPDYLRAACEASMRRLRLETIELYQLHMPDPQVPLQESLGALEQLRSEGKIRNIGVCNLLGETLEAALSTTPLASVQNRYSLSSRAAQGDLDECERRGIVFMPWAPLELGSLAAEEGEAGRIAKARGATPAQVALAWLLQRSPVTLPIPGTSSVEHLEQNIAAASLRLSDEELEQLDREPG